MELGAFFKSIIEQDTAPVVVCNTEHKIIYMNPAAIKNYSKSGGDALIGKSILDCHNNRSNDIIKSVVRSFIEDKDKNIVFTHFNVKKNSDIYMVALRDDNGNLIGYYEKHESRTREVG